MNNYKRGIAVMSLVTAVAIILILLTTVTISGINTAHNAKKIAFGSEIKMIQSAVDSYYIKNNATYPTKGNAYIIDFSGNNISEKNKYIFGTNEGNDKTSFSVYEIDYEKLEITDLTYGNKKQGNDDEKEKDIYVVSRNSGKVYYLKGLEIGNEKYYTVTDDIENLLSYNSEKNTVNSPVVKFKPSTTEWTNDDVTVTISLPSTIDSLNSVTFTGSSETKDLTPSDLKSKSISCNIDENGTLVVKYYEKIDSTSEKEAKYIISNIDKEAPKVVVDTDELIQISSRGDLGYIKIKEKSDNLSGIKYLKYDYGKYEKDEENNAIKHFHASGQDIKEDLIFFRSFTEDITIYAEDNAGEYIILNITPSGEIKEEQGSIEPEIPKDAKVYPYVPKGFSKVEVSEEWTPTKNQLTLDGQTYYKARGCNGGLVIQNDSNGDQFVWVPVEIDEEYRNGISEDPANINLKGLPRISLVDFYTVEPVNLASVGDLDNYRSMKSSIIRYGGFYVARYKARIVDGKYRITGEGKAAEERFTTFNYSTSVDYNYVEWDLVNAISEYKGTEYRYSLIFGIQWDRIAEWGGLNIQELNEEPCEWTREMTDQGENSYIGMGTETNQYAIVVRGGNSDLSTRKGWWFLYPEYAIGENGETLGIITQPTAGVRITLIIN